jgi:hypothetical protein
VSRRDGDATDSSNIAAQTQQFYTAASASFSTHTAPIFFSCASMAVTSTGPIICLLMFGRARRIERAGMIARVMTTDFPISVTSPRATNPGVWESSHRTARGAQISASSLCIFTPSHPWFTPSPFQALLWGIMSSQDGAQESLKKNSELSHVSASSDMSTYTRAMLFGLVWWAIIIFFYIQVRPRISHLFFIA